MEGTNAEEKQRSKKRHKQMQIQHSFAPGKNSIVAIRNNVIFYSPKVFHTSKFYNAIVPIRIRDIQERVWLPKIYGSSSMSLNTRNIIIINNHPIRRVCIIGRVISHTKKSQCHKDLEEVYHHLVICDTSGSCIECVVPEHMVIGCGMRTSTWANEWSLVKIVGEVTSDSELSRPAKLIPMELEIVRRKNQRDASVEFQWWKQVLSFRSLLAESWVRKEEGENKREYFVESSGDNNGIDNVVFINAAARERWNVPQDLLDLLQKINKECEGSEGEGSEEEGIYSFEDDNEDEGARDVDNEDQSDESEEEIEENKRKEKEKEFDIDYKSAEFDIQIAENFNGDNDYNDKNEINDNNDINDNENNKKDNNIDIDTEVVSDSDIEEIEINSFKEVQVQTEKIQEAQKLVQNTAKEFATKPHINKTQNTNTNTENSTNTTNISHKMEKKGNDVAIQDVIANFRIGGQSKKNSIDSQKSTFIHNKKITGTSTEPPTKQPSSIHQIPSNSVPRAFSAHTLTPSLNHSDITALIKMPSLKRYLLNNKICKSLIFDGYNVINKCTFSLQVMKFFLRNHNVTLNSSITKQYRDIIPLKMFYKDTELCNFATLVVMKYYFVKQFGKFSGYKVDSRVETHFSNVFTLSQKYFVFVSQIHENSIGKLIFGSENVQIMATIMKHIRQDFTRRSLINGLNIGGELFVSYTEIKAMKKLISRKLSEYSVASYSQYLTCFRGIIASYLAGASKNRLDFQLVAKLPVLRAISSELVSSAEYSATIRMRINSVNWEMPVDGVDGNEATDGLVFIVDKIMDDCEEEALSAGERYVMRSLSGTVQPAMIEIVRQQTSMKKLIWKKSKNYTRSLSYER